MSEIKEHGYHVMKVDVSINVDEITRRAINVRLGKPGLASCEEVAAHIELCFDADTRDAVEEMLARRKSKTTAHR